MKTRCNKCREKIDYGYSLCDKCKSKYIKDKKQGLKNKDAERHIKSSRWKKVREQILLRDKCCILCLKRGIFEHRQLQVHHIIKRADDISLAYEPSNLITLCRTCHDEVEELSPSRQKELFGYKPKEIEFYL